MECLSVGVDHGEPHLQEGEVSGLALLAAWERHTANGIRVELECGIIPRSYCCGSHLQHSVWIGCVKWL